MDDIVGNLPQKALALLQTAAQRFDKSFKALPSLQLRHRLGVVRQRWRNRQPEADEESQSFSRQPDVSFQSLLS